MRHASSGRNAGGYGGDEVKRAAQRQSYCAKQAPAEAHGEAATAAAAVAGERRFVEAGHAG